METKPTIETTRYPSSLYYPQRSYIINKKIRAYNVRSASGYKYNSSSQ